MSTTFKPTHKITVTTASGSRTISVMLHAEGDGCGPAYTREEYASETSADWELTPRGWLCQGQATPGGGNGSVRVAKV